ncbi:MAG: SDR family oxidoreductase [Candidatus Omnitrophota bacterium]
MNLAGKKVLVTGGAGFIGSHIVARLVAEDARVVVLDNLKSGKLENLSGVMQKIQFIKKDIRDEAALEEALSGVEYVSHQAALRSVPKSVEAPFDYHDVNVTGTLRLFLKAREAGVKRIACASSSSVYGERTDFPEKESDLPKPVSPYAASKLMTEHYAYLFTTLYGLEVVSLRYFNVFGPRQSLDDEYAVVIPKFTVSLLRDEAPPIYGDGGQERDFTYIDNVVDANICALCLPGVGGEVFNVAQGDPHSVNELFASLKNILKKDISPAYLPPRKGDVRKTHACIEKTKRLLHWDPKVDFNEGLQRTADWFKKEFKRT